MVSIQMSCHGASRECSRLNDLTDLAVEDMGTSTDEGGRLQGGQGSVNQQNLKKLVGGVARYSMI